MRWASSALEIIVAPEPGPPALASLRALLAESRLDLPSELPPMAAGVFGYMGYDTVRVLAAHLKGQPVEKSVDTGCALVTKENFDTPDVKKVLGLNVLRVMAETGRELADLCGMDTILPMNTGAVAPPARDPAWLGRLFWGSAALVESRTA